MKYYVDFIDGYFSKNIINALEGCCDLKALLLLREQKLLAFDKHDYILTSRSLNLSAINQYISATHCHAKDFLYEKCQPVFLSYTPHDDFVISSLNTLLNAELCKVEAFTNSFFPNSFFDLPETQPNRRLTAVLSRLPRGALLISEKKPFSPPAWKHFYRNLEPDILRYAQKNNFSPRFIFDSNLWPDWATFAGVSLHWLFRLETPLYCDTQEADVLFDRYTLMQPHEQEQFRDLLCSVLDGKKQKYEQLLEAKRGV